MQSTLSCDFFHVETNVDDDDDTLASALKDINGCKNPFDDMKRRRERRKEKKCFGENYQIDNTEEKYQ